MINTRQNLLFISTILSLCIVSFVHVFVFPLYELDARRASDSKRTYRSFEQTLCAANPKRNLLRAGYHLQRTKKSTRCPQYGIVTVVQGGRLGNQMWEYASVWAVARRTGLEAYVPRCLKGKLEQVFEGLSVPSFEEILSCKVDLGSFVRSLEMWNFTNQSIVLPRYFIQPELVLTWVQDVVQEFAIKRRFVEKAQEILRYAGRSYETFVGVHVRRTDYISYLWRKYSTSPALPSFYLDSMSVFERKYPKVFFVVVSDDPSWTRKNLVGNKSNVFVTARLLPNPPALDLAFLAACNHSIFDYGTFGEWGAILAGGETIYYNLSHHSSAQIGRFLPKWRAFAP